MRDVNDGTDRITDTIGYMGTGNRTLEITLGMSPSYYRLEADREDFEEQALALLRAWRAGEPVTATLRGTTILSLSAGS
jgi:hypothetical protein